MVANRWFQHRKTEEEEGFDRRFVILRVLGVLSMVGSLSLETINDQTNLKFGRWGGGGRGEEGTKRREFGTKSARVTTDLVYSVSSCLSSELCRRGKRVIKGISLFRKLDATKFIASRFKRLNIDPLRKR